MAEEKARAPEGASGSNWYLGFDCATKTFAFSLSRVDLAAYREAGAGAGLRRRAAAAAELVRRAEQAAAGAPARARELAAAAGAALAALDRETKAVIQIADGETQDLFPGRLDKDISTVERVRAVVRYVAARIRPAVEARLPRGEKPHVVVEFQMGPNAPARVVAAALITLFAEDDVFIVGPTLKNKVATREEGRYCYFAEKYRTTYTANKAHAKYNFAVIEEVFGTGISGTISPALRGHIADSFMQVLGHLVHGDKEKAASRF